MAFLKTLRRTVSLIDLPFGYTLTVWGSGAVALDRFGLPSLVDAFVFLFGAVGAYLICAVVSFPQPYEATTLRVTDVALINVFSIIAAAVVSVVSHLFYNPGIGYFVAGFIGTLTYILCISALMYQSEQISHRK